MKIIALFAVVLSLLCGACAEYGIELGPELEPEPGPAEQNVLVATLFVENTDGTVVQLGGESKKDPESLMWVEGFQGSEMVNIEIEVPQFGQERVDYECILEAENGFLFDSSLYGTFDQTGHLKTHIVVQQGVPFGSGSLYCVVTCRDTGQVALTEIFPIFLDLGVERE